MKRKVTRCLALLMSLVLMNSMEFPHVFANEYEIEENSAIDDIGNSFSQTCEVKEDIELADTKNIFPDRKIMNIDKKLDSELAVEIKGDELSLYVGDEIQVQNADDETEQKSII